MWLKLQAIDWRWPPDVIMRQDDRLMEDIATIDAEYRKVKNALRKEKGETDAR